jgi:cytochrome c peroxidase
MPIRSNRSAAVFGATVTVGLITAAAAFTVGRSNVRTPTPTELCSPGVDIAAVVIRDPEFVHISARTDSIFKATVAQVTDAMRADRYHQVALLGKLLLYDRKLSVNGDVACVTCHTDETGYTGGVELINRTIVAYPSSAGPATGARKPQSYGYAAFAPVLHYREKQKDFAGANFWDMRATGTRLGNAAAEQAQGPPLDPNEMALPDPACAVFRVSRGPYRALFETVWGPQAFAVKWPADVERVCARPAPAPATDPHPVHLDSIDRGIVASTYDFMALAMASYEVSSEVSPFSSRFDVALAHPDQKILTDDELAGWTLFRGKAKCNTCHLDGTAKAGNDTRTMTRDAADAGPLFTDFTAVNIGVPKNRALRFYCENTPNNHGFTPNPEGNAHIDRGVGNFLRSSADPNLEWAQFARQFDGAVRVPTLRNVDRRPRATFIKAYTHNGYLKSLKEVVHFYNTRDALPRCNGDDDPREKTGCWPPPEVTANVNMTIGKLGLTDREEDQIVAFLRTLTDAPPVPLRVTPRATPRKW